MLHPILWYLLISILGWLALPLAYRLFPALPDRGYTLARTLGLLVWGYSFWLLASLGLLGNDAGGLLLALALLVALSAVALRRGAAGELLHWLSARWRWVMGVEVLFLAAFAGMALVRAANPEILGTEKPMELAFINAILSSPTFPPHDPWLSGFAISYYYFGYVMVAMLAKLFATPGSIAFNLGVTLVFALSALGAYGVAFNLLAARLRRETPDLEPSRPPVDPPQRYTENAALLALLGPLFVLLAANLTGFLEVLHAGGVFWRASPSGVLTSGFWSWLDLRELSEPPVQPYTWMPQRYLWWWRASRVVQDYDFAGGWKEVIDEFPAFSYILADLHPHVLAMPFAFLGMALAFNLYLGGAGGRLDWLELKLKARSLGWIAALLLAGGLAALVYGSVQLNPRTILLGLICLVLGGYTYFNIPIQARLAGFGLLLRPDLGEMVVGRRFSLSTPAFLFAALVLGGLGFLNTWDFPFYVVLVAGAYAVRRWQVEGAPFGEAVGDFLALAVALVAFGVAAYLPFYLGFSSQANGILPNLAYPTRGAHLWVMFAPLLLPISAYLAHRWRKEPEQPRLGRGLALAGGLLLALWLLSLIFAAVISRLPLEVSSVFLGSIGAPDFASALTGSLARRLTNFGGWLSLLLLLGTSLAFFFNRAAGLSEAQIGRFALLLVLLGALLVTGPEFFFLWDLFGWRINTIFKFYYQAWLLWAVAAAYASAVLIGVLRRGPALAFSLGLALLLCASLTYTLLGLWTKTNGFNPPSGWTLDGTAYLETQQPDEMAAADWLRRAPPGVVAEAIGGSYTGYARISAWSGQPAVLGWDFHEMQWRGSTDLFASRPGDIQRLYCTRDANEAQAILEQYDIRYVFIGALERSTYSPEVCPGGLNEAKFRSILTQVFNQGQVVIYAAH